MVFPLELIWSGQVWRVGKNKGNHVNLILNHEENKQKANDRVMGQREDRLS